MSFLIKFLLILILHFFDTKGFFPAVSGQDVPSSPCPEVFKYFQHSNGNVYGRITLPNDGSTTLSLGVNASMKGYHTDKRKVSLKIKIDTPDQDLIEGRARTLSYTVNFPFQRTIPKITSIELNNRNYCSGPPEELVPGASGVTSLWAGHKFYFQTGNRIGGPEPSVPEDIDDYVRQPVTTTQRLPPVSFLPSPSDQRIDTHVEQPTRNKIPEDTQKYQCGVGKNQIVQLILGGADVSDGVFPWLTAMFAFQGSAYEYKCTGNLVSEKHIITAARCIFHYKVQTVQTDDILFVFGKSNLKNWAANGTVTRGASEVLSHPDFSPDTGHGDISIITLNKPLQYSDTISPICLWSGDNDLADIVHKKGTIAGWGATTRAPTPSQYSVLVAKSVDIPVVSQDECLNSDLTYYSLTSDKTFCAGQKDDKGTCIGDFGAGFMINKENKYYLRGLTSLQLTNSKGECNTAFFMVFCDVAKFTDWIKLTIK